MRSIGSHLIGATIINLIGFLNFLFRALVVLAILIKRVLGMFGDELLELRVESVLNCVVGPAWYGFSYFAPAVAVLSVHQ